MARKKYLSAKEKFKNKKKKRKKIELYWENVDWERVEKIFQKDRDNILQSLQKKVNYYPYKKEILKLMAAGTLIAGSFVMPGLPKVLKLLPDEWWYPEGYQPTRLRQSLKRLEKQKEIEVVKTKHGPALKVTQKGMVSALRFKLDEIEIKKPVKWDRKWRLVIFDISEKKRGLRNLLRDKLKDLGFYHLQESVFIYPFPCEAEIDFLRRVLGLEEEVVYILAQDFEGSEIVRTFFTL